jgi:hypothetical protein
MFLCFYVVASLSLASLSSRVESRESSCLNQSSFSLFSQLLLFVHISNTFSHFIHTQNTQQ